MANRQTARDHTAYRRGYARGYAQGSGPASGKGRPAFQKKVLIRLGVYAQKIESTESDIFGKAKFDIVLGGDKILGQPYLT